MPPKNKWMTGFAYKIASELLKNALTFNMALQSASLSSGYRIVDQHSQRRNAGPFSFGLD